MDKQKGLGCVETFVPTFDFSENNIDKSVPNKKKCTQEKSDNIDHKNNTKLKAHKRLQQQLQILRVRYGNNYGYFD